MRFINGVTDAPASSTMTLNANSASIGGGIAAGAASGYASVLGSINGINFLMSSSAVGGTYYTNNQYVLSPGSTFDVGNFTAFLAEQPDLGPKQRPTVVRISTTLPRTATFKVIKRLLSAEALDCTDPVFGNSRARVLAAGQP